MNRVDITELIELKNKAKKLETKGSELISEAATIYKEIASKCTHPAMIKTEKYHSGGYDYQSEVRITEMCSICSTVLKSYSDPKHKGSYE